MPYMNDLVFAPDCTAPEQCFDLFFCSSWYARNQLLRYIALRRPCITHQRQNTQDPKIEFRLVSIQISL